jgi:hypothetical protein
VSSGPGVHRASSGQIPATGDTPRAAIRAMTRPCRTSLDFQFIMIARIGSARAGTTVDFRLDSSRPQRTLLIDWLA